MDWLDGILTEKPASTYEREPELFLAIIPEKPVLYYTLFQTGNQWGARCLEPDSALVFELSDFGKPWREDSKAEMIRAVKEAYPHCDVCHVSHNLLQKLQSDRQQGKPESE